MVACGWGGRYALYADQLPGTAFTAPRAVRAGSGPWYFLDARADLGRKLNDSKTKTMEAVGIEPLAIHLIQVILERFRGQVSAKTRRKKTNKPS
jgi:homogentisate 1,2-dioxygenase